MPSQEELLEDAFDKTKSLKLMTAMKNIEETRKQIDKVIKGAFTIIYMLQTISFPSKWFVSV